jgi:hypothetical protein
MHEMVSAEKCSPKKPTQKKAWFFFQVAAQQMVVTKSV